MSLTTLHLTVETDVPARLAVRPTRVLYVAGWCFDEQHPIRHLELAVNGRSEPVIAARMPRYDVHQQFRRQSWAGMAYRSGFWGIVTLGADGGSTAHLTLRVWTDEMREYPVGEVELEPVDRAPSADDGVDSSEAEPPVAICMATYNPHPLDFKRQIASIRAQSYTNWICIVNDDHSDEAAFARIRDEVSGDQRFRLSRNPQRLGYYLNFAEVLRLAPSSVAHIALCDQDDIWYPQKLATLMQRMRQDGSVLVFSDMRIVDRSLRVLDTSFWRVGYRNNFTDLGALLSANTVTGAASLFSRAVIDAALPFPHVRSAYHDHWLACVALALGTVSYIDRPLYDYVQHSQNVLGHRGRPGPQNPGGRSPQNWYFVCAIVTMIFSRELLARLDGQLTPVKRVALERAAALDSRRGMFWLANRWRRRPAEVRGPKLLIATLWRRAMSRMPGPPNRMLAVEGSTGPCAPPRREPSE